VTARRSRKIPKRGPHNSPLDVAIGARLRALRIARKLSQTDLGKRNHPGRSEWERLRLELFAPLAHATHYAVNGIWSQLCRQTCCEDREIGL
jgi:hypothetical protein